MCEYFEEIYYFLKLIQKVKILTLKVYLDMVEKVLAPFIK